LDILGELIALPQPDLQSVKASEKGWFLDGVKVTGKQKWKKKKHKKNC